MNSVFDYLKWRGDLSFAQDPVNSVDALVFSALAYIRYTDRVQHNPHVPVTLEEAGADFFALEDTQGRYRVKKDLELLEAASRTRRFGRARLCMYRDLYIPEQETQFAAMAFLLDDGSAMLSFRGTDETLIGWKEDFNMSFQQTVPAQRLAQQYTREFGAEFDMPLRLCGHSKGGNLAVFAAARSAPALRQRMLRVYNLDGPGFTEYMLGDPGYDEIVPRICTLVPQSSVIGMLLEHEEPYTVVKSNQVSLLQHEIYSWEVMGRDFILMEQITEDSRFLNLTIKNWVGQMTNAERNDLVDALFGVLASGEVETAVDIFHPKNLRHYIKAVSSNANIRRIFSGELQNLVAAVRLAREQFSEEKRLEEAREQE